METSTFENTSQGFKIKETIRVSVKRQSLMVQTIETNDPKQCRICLQNENENDKEFVAPCNCIGSVRYIHKLCFVEWMKKKFQDHKLQHKVREGKQKIKCEICRQDFDYQLSQKQKTRNCQEIHNQFKSNKPLALVFIIFFLLELGLVSYIGVYAYNDTKLQSYDLKSPKFVLVLCALGVVFIGLLYGVCEFISTFFTKKQEQFIVKNKETKQLLIECITKKAQNKLEEPIHPEN